MRRSFEKAGRSKTLVVSSMRRSSNPQSDGGSRLRRGRLQHQDGIISDVHERRRVSGQVDQIVENSATLLELLDRQGSSSDDLAKSQLALQAVRDRSSRVEGWVSQNRSDAQQWLALDFLIFGVMAAAALGIEQINVEVQAVHRGIVPHSDHILTNAGLISVAVIALGALLSAVFAFMVVWWKQVRQLGPDLDQIAVQVHAAPVSEGPIILALVIQADTERTMTRLVVASQLLVLSIYLLVAGFVAGGIIFGVMAG
jgi:hypothetical protein